jgi:hypothetical protein
MWKDGRDRQPTQGPEQIWNRTAGHRTQMHWKKDEDLWYL